MDYTTIAASIEQARADIRAQIDDLRERDVALEQSLTWAAIAYGIDTDANGEPITVEGEGSGPVSEPPPEVVHVAAKPSRKGGPRTTVDYDAIAEWIKAAKVAGTYSQSVMAEHFNVPVTTAKNWIVGCKKRGLLDEVVAIPVTSPAEPLPAGAVVDLDMARALL